MKETIKQVTKLIYLLQSDPVDKQMYQKEIKLLFDILAKLSRPVVINQ